MILILHTATDMLQQICPITHEYITNSFDRHTMPEYVPHYSIVRQVVSDWDRLVRATALSRGDELSSVQPFHTFEQTYPEVMAEIKSCSEKGLEFYRTMVRQLPWYAFELEDGNLQRIQERIT